MTPKSFVKRTVTLLAVSLAFAGVAQAGTVLETINSNPHLTTLSKLIQTSGLSDSLNAAGPVTIFAPTNEAFKRLSSEKVTELSANQAALKSLLGFHVVPGNLTTAVITNGDQKTSTGDSISLYKSGTFLTVDDAAVTQADVSASNGVVQVIDRVLTPPKK